MLCLSRAESWPRPSGDAVSAAISIFRRSSGPKDSRYSNDPNLVLFPIGALADLLRFLLGFFASSGLLSFLRFLRLLPVFLLPPN